MTDPRMRDEDGFLTEHDPEPGHPQGYRWPEEEVGVCSQCRANTGFVMDPYEKELMSVCCWRPMYDAPDEP